MKGRKPIPSKIINLRGGSAYTHRPPRTNEPQPSPGLPPCPRHLKGEARKEWHRAGKELQACGILAKLDRSLFISYCQYFARWREASDKVAEKGLFIMSGRQTTTKTLKDGSVTVKERHGEPRISPMLRAEMEAFDRMCRCLLELGMSPTSRSRIKVDMPKPKTKIEEFLARKNGSKN